MRLSDLKTGESATILKVLGHGGFRRRIMEMGFVRGKKVEVVLNAPLHDPIVYRIMDYEVSLRRSEAQMVVVITNEEAEGLISGEYNGTREGDQLHEVIARAENWLLTHPCATPVLKWDTAQWGEIPADFGRK